MCTSCRCGDPKCPSCGDDKVNLEKALAREQAEILKDLMGFWKYEGRLDPEFYEVNR